MSTKIISDKFAGKSVWLGDGKVAFDEKGVAIGVAKRDGRALDPPEPVGESQIEAALASKSYRVEGEGEPVVPQEAPADAPVTPEGAPAVEEVSQPVETPAEGTEPQEGEAEGVVAGEPEEEALERDADLAEMTRSELYRLAQDLGLAPEWLSSTSDGLRETIVAARDEANAE